MVWKTITSGWARWLMASLIKNQSTVGSLIVNVLCAPEAFMSERLEPADVSDITEFGAVSVGAESAKMP